MTIVISCQKCGSIQQVIDDQAIEKSMYTAIGKEAVAGRIIERYKPGDTSFKKSKFRGEVDCDTCGSSTDSTALFGKPEDDEPEDDETRKKKSMKAGA
jgi:DNA-directed RNA polymerase subunit M/transcription elongation factor TFIIS